MDGTTRQALLPSLDEARSVLAAQPFSQVIGAELTAFTHGSAELRIDLRDELLQQHGFVHGGVLSYAADNALTFAGGTVLGGAGVVTRGFAIDYLRPAQGVMLRATAHVVDHEGRQAVCRCEILAVGDDGDETLCATAQGTINRTFSSTGPPWTASIGDG